VHGKTKYRWIESPGTDAIYFVASVSEVVFIIILLTPTWTTANLPILFTSIIGTIIGFRARFCESKRLGHSLLAIEILLWTICMAMFKTALWKQFLGVVIGVSSNFFISSNGSEAYYWMRKGTKWDRSAPPE
jgi:hypothetical protein